MYTELQKQMLSSFTVEDLDDMIYKNGLPISMEMEDKKQLFQNRSWKDLTNYRHETVCDEELCPHNHLFDICDDCYNELNFREKNSDNFPVA